MYLGFYSNWLLSPKRTKYVESLVCRTCKGFARLKCTWCKVNLTFSQLLFSLLVPQETVLQHQVPGGGEGGAQRGVQGDPREKEGRGGAGGQGRGGGAGGQGWGGGQGGGGGAGGQGGGVSPRVGPGSLP